MLASCFVIHSAFQSCGILGYLSSDILLKLCLRFFFHAVLKETHIDTTVLTPAAPGWMYSDLSEM